MSEDTDRMSSTERTERCLIHAASLERLWDYQRRFPHTEKFGLGLGSREAGVAHVLGFLWPRQTHESSGCCSMDRGDLGVIVPCLVELAQSRGLATSMGVSAWVHTHPNIGVFLSGTDRSTLGNWAEVSPGIVGIVFDAFTGGAPTFGVFDGSFAEVPYDVVEQSRMSGPEGFWQDLLDELPRRLAVVESPVEALITPIGTHYLSEVAERPLV